MTVRTGEQGRGGGRITPRAAAWLAWSLTVLSVAVFLATVPLFVLARSAPVPSSWGVQLSVASLVASAIFLVFPIVGGLVAARHPRNPIGWILLADGLLWILSGLMDYYSTYGGARPGSVPFALGVAGINSFLWVPGVGLLGTYAIMLFPDGRLPSKRWRPLAWLSGATIVLISVAVAIDPGPLQNSGGTPNPFGLEWLEGHPWILDAAFVVLPVLPACMLASALSLVMRYRRSVGEERQQIKWMAFAASLIGALYLVAMATSLVFPSGAWFQAGSPLWMDVLAYAALASFTLVPIAIGFAVLRYRLYDIDVVINRALVYGSLTATLAGAYFGSVVVLQSLFRLLTGQESQLAIVASTLAIAALFVPLRRRTQGFVDRRFYRRKYDAAKTLEAFSATLREETDLGALTENLTGVVRQTVQPEHVSVWLRLDATDSKFEQSK